MLNLNLASSVAYKLNPDKLGGPTEPFNNVWHVAVAFHECASAIIGDLAEARATGVPIKNKFENPNSRERAKNGVFPLCTYVTDMRQSDLDASLRRIHTLAMVAGAIVQRDTVCIGDDEYVFVDNGDLDRVQTAIRAALAQMKGLDRDIYVKVFQDAPSTWLKNGELAAMLSIEGTSWNSSGKGNSAYTRYDSTADARIAANKSEQDYVAMRHYVSERDIVGEDDNALY